MKKRLLSGVVDRMGSFEEQELYAISATLDPRSVFCLVWSQFIFACQELAEWLPPGGQWAEGQAASH